MTSRIAAAIANPDPGTFTAAEARRDFLLFARTRGLTVRPENLGQSHHRITPASCATGAATVADLIEPHRQNAALHVRAMIAAHLASRMAPTPDGAA